MDQILEKDVSIDSYALLLVRCNNFPTLRLRHRNTIRFSYALDPKTYEILAFESEDLAALENSADVQNPYNPSSPDSELIRVHGEDFAKQLMRKRFLDRCCKMPSKTFAVYLYCMARYFPDDYCWILKYLLRRVFALDMEIPIVPTDFVLLGVISSLDQVQFDLKLEESGFDQNDVLSTIPVNHGLYEVWVAKNILPTFCTKFQVMDGFDPILSIGVFETAIAEDRLQERMQGTSFAVQQLYLYFLKSKWPSSYKSIVEVSERKVRNDFFLLSGIGQDTIAFSLSALRQDFQAALVVEMKKRRIQGQTLSALEAGKFFLRDTRGRFIPPYAWNSISAQDKIELVFKEEKRFPILQSEILKAGTVLPQIWLGGDSYVEHSERVPQGLAPFLRRDLAGIFDVVARGFSEFNSLHFLRLLPQMLPNDLTVQVQIMVLWLGSNDCCDSNINQCGLKLEDFVDNLTSILKFLAERRIDVILITLPPRAIEEHWESLKTTSFDGQICEIQQSECIRRYAQAIKDLAKCFRLSVVDSELEFSKVVDRLEGGLSSMYEDGFHLNETGYAPINAKLQEIISHKINRQLHSTLGEL